jgi:hypothetical protein
VSNANSNSNLDLTVDQVNHLLSTKAIREQAQKILELTQKNEGHFVLDESRYPACVDFVLETIQQNYPDLNIPFHSRWGHFNAGKINRYQDLSAQISKFDRLERARIEIDLVVTSVLLDAGAGMTWQYSEASTGLKIGKSEGLALASLHLFLAGVFADDKTSLRSDASALANFNEDLLKKYFQVRTDNPLEGLAGRVTLIRSLGAATLNKKYFSTPRPGAMVDFLTANPTTKIKATQILDFILHAFGPIWPARLQAQGKSLGDCWQHSKVGLTPFHKLSQWLTYSCLEPLMRAGIEIEDLHQLTGLAEYRNGGLMLDSEILQWRDPKEAQQEWHPSSDVIIEWRALTIVLLDRMAKDVRAKLKMSEAAFPLAKVLEGGTWWAGRRWAQKLRADGGPPVKIKSDGTVF